MSEDSAAKRIVLVSAPNHGHAVPLLLVGQSLAHAGHLVTMVCSEKNSAWVLARPEVAPPGGLVEAVVLQDGPKEPSEEEPGGKQTPLQQLGRMGRKFAEQLRVMHACDPVDLLLFDVWVRAAPVVAAELQIPCVLQWYGDAGTLDSMLDFHASPLLDMAIGQRRRASHRAALPNLRRAGLPVLVPSSPAIGPPSPLPRGTRMIGLLQQRIRNPDLASQPDLREFLESARLPVIFVTLGSELRTDEDMRNTGHEPTLVSALFDGLDSEKWAVVWACAETLRHHLPAMPGGNFFLSPWVPQADVIAHTRVRAVLTHCGWGCFRECLVHGKPMIGLPFFGDQIPNAQRLPELGVGIALETTQVQAQDVRSAVRELLVRDPVSYRRAAKLLSHRLEEEQPDVASEVLGALPEARAAVRACQQGASGAGQRGQFSQEEMKELGGLLSRAFANLHREEGEEGEAAKPWPADRMPPFQLFIAGTWNGYEPRAMSWREGSFEYTVEVGASGWESFQILVDGSWEFTFYPSVPDASVNNRCRIMGPDDQGHGKNWQIGRGGAEQALPGAHFVVSASLSDRGGVSAVAWRPR